MHISDEELELFRNWQPGDSITMDMNSVGMLIQEVIRSRVALRLPGEPGATEPESRGGDRQIIVKKGEKVNDEGSRK